MKRNLMQRWARVLSLITTLLALPQISHAQITLYNRTVLSGQTYTQVSGGTVINANAQLSTGMSNNADDGALLVTLPFTFTYDGVPYTQVTFCTNGWIGMGNRMATTAAQGRAAGNLFTTTAPNTTIAAWFGDGSGNWTGAGIGSMVHGAAGTGVYAFEWRNATGNGFTASATNTINFMIKLYGPASSNPGRIELLYGVATATPSVNRSIGIEDAVGGANHFINAINGSFTSTATSPSWPGNGNGYRFDPPPPCTGTPTAGTITAPATVCAGSNFTMSVTGQSIAYLITYQWQSRPASGGTFTNVTGATAPTLTTTITAPTEFRCIVTCAATGLSATTPVVSIGINSFYVCYCKNALGGNTAVSIDSVKILETTLNNGSPGTATGSYTQYPPTGSTTATLQAGGLYRLKVKYGASALGSLWIDANQNGTFENTEWVRINTSGTDADITFSVPPTAVNGLTGLRIRSTAPTATNGAGNACSNIASGETEDYVVNIIPAPNDDIRLVTILEPAERATYCPYKPIPVKAVIYNNGTNPHTGFDITTDLSGPLPNSVSLNYTKTLAPFTTDTVALVTYNLHVAGSYTVRSQVFLMNDQNRINDSSVNVHFTLLPAPASPRTRIDSVCIGEEGLLYVYGDTLQHKWYADDAYQNLVYTGDTMRIPNMSSDALYYVTSQDATPNRGSLSTITSGVNGCGGGAMFNIIPNMNLTVDSFAALFNSTGSQTVNVYYRVGTFAGNETNAGAWTLLGTATVNAASTSALTGFSVNAPLILSSGITYGIYINYDAAYDNGNASYSNPDMTIQTGTGLCSQFGGTNADRMFNGTIFYRKGFAGCESYPVAINAYVGPAPTVNLGPDIKSCEGLNIILDAGHAGGKYRWNTGEATQAISVKDRPGTYWVEVDRYCLRSDTVVVQLDPLPRATGISYTRAGRVYSFEAAGATDVKSFIWMFGDGTTNTSSLSPQHTYANDDLYMVKLILFNDCGSDTIYQYVPVGVSNVSEEEKSIILYPNPANSNITVEAGADITQVVIMNAAGSIVYSKQGMVGNKQTIDISNIPAGTYMMRIGGKEGFATKPFTISR